MLIPCMRLLFKLRSSSYINWCNSFLIKRYTNAETAWNRTMCRSLSFWHAFWLAMLMPYLVPCVKWLLWELGLCFSVFMSKTHHNNSNIISINIPLNIRVVVSFNFFFAYLFFFFFFFICCCYSLPLFLFFILISIPQDQRMSCLCAKSFSQKHSREQRKKKVNWFYIIIHSHIHTHTLTLTHSHHHHTHTYTHTISFAEWLHSMRERCASSHAWPNISNAILFHANLRKVINLVLKVFSFLRCRIFSSLWSMVWANTNDRIKRKIRIEMWSS